MHRTLLWAGLLGLAGSLLGAVLGTLISSQVLEVLRTTSSVLYEWTFSPLPPLLGILAGTLTTVIFAVCATMRRSDTRRCAYTGRKSGTSSAVAAAVQAQLGGSLEQVAGGARAALEPKSLQLSPAAPQPRWREPEEKLGSAEQDRELRLAVHPRLGLHLRPAARFVQTATRFRADIRVTNISAARGPVSAQSINGLMTLAVRQGHEILVTASGPEAEAGLAALQALAQANFGDENQASTPTPEEYRAAIEPPHSSFLQGLPASPGIAIGLARLFRSPTPKIPAHSASNPQAEWEALCAAIGRTRLQFQAARDAVVRRAGAASAAILEAHLLCLDDSALRDPARRAILEERCNAAAAW